MNRNTQGRYGETSSRLLQLKPAIDRIIADCKSDGGELRSGLDILKNYQLDIIEELERSEGRRGGGYYSTQYPSNTPFHEMQRDNSRVLRNGRGQAGRSHQFPIENKREFYRIPLDEREENDYYEEDDYPDYQPPRDGRRNIPTYGAYYEDEVKGFDNGPSFYPQRREHYDSSSDSQSKDDLIRNLIAQNKRLKALVNQLQIRLEESSNRLYRAEEQSGLSKIRQDLLNLKRQNEQLRQNTIRLLGDKTSQFAGAGQQDTHWKRQFERLQQQIQNQNRLKYQFLEELTKFKARYKQAESQKRQLQEKLNRIRGNQGIRGEQRIQYEQRGNINKYKTALEDVRNRY